jgi:aminoglycoside phosphotransferase (APT) family kinase protein
VVPLTCYYISVSNINVDDVRQAVAISKLQGFTGSYRELGGGELNDTFVLDCGSHKAVLRVAKNSDTKTLPQEAEALGLLNLKQVPKLLYFDESNRIKDRLWILESYLEGSATDSLSVAQFRNLGALLAQVHKVSQPKPSTVNFWSDFLDACMSFGDESVLLNHSDQELRELINRAYAYFKQRSGSVRAVLTHGDVTPSNTLFNGDDVSLIDWELSTFKDPMADFSTLYYEDMEYNKGKWRLHIKQEERTALFDGYTKAGGVINEKRLHTWMNVDKLGAAVYLYWKMHQSGHLTDDSRLRQYQVDYRNLMESLERNLPKAKAI